MTATQASIQVSPATQPGIVVVTVPGPQGIPGQDGTNAVVYRWGEVPVGSRSIGTPGGIGFGMSDPLFTDDQYTWLSNFLNATKLRVTDLEQKVSILYDLYLREVALRLTGITIGVPGAINFGVGPAATTGTPVGVSEQDYYPVHANSDSFM